MKDIELVLMYDYYSCLLDENEKKYFEIYYFDNMSLQEISEEYGVSRNAVFKQLKKVKEKLEFYDCKLQLIQKSKKLKSIIDTIDDDKLKKQLSDIDL